METLILKSNIHIQGNAFFFPEIPNRSSNIPTVILVDSISLVALESNKSIKSMLMDLLLLCHCYWYDGNFKINDADP